MFVFEYTRRERHSQESSTIFVVRLLRLCGVGCACCVADAAYLKSSQPQATRTPHSVISREATSNNKRECCRGFFLLVASPPVEVGSRREQRHHTRACDYYEHRGTTRAPSASPTLEGPARCCSRGLVSTSVIKPVFDSIPVQ